jgi:hypothetical protein
LQHLSPDLTTDRFYSDSKSSVIDPEKWKAYVASSGPYKNLGQHIVDAADAYRATGSREAAECAIRHAEAAATDGVLTGKMSSNQAYNVQGWVIGAICYRISQDTWQWTGPARAAARHPALDRERGFSRRNTTMTPDGRRRRATPKTITYIGLA